MAAASASAVTVAVAAVATAWIEKEEDEEGRVKKFHFSKSKGVLFPFSKSKGVVSESENRFLWERKKNMISLGCLKEKTNGYSLVVQYPLVEEGRRLKV